MIYSTSRCPYCKQIVRKETNPVPEIGNPFERCTYCGGVYVNQNKSEWITKSPRQRFFFFLHGGVWARALLCPLILSMLIAGTADQAALAFFLWFAGFVAWLIGAYFFYKNRSVDEINQSLKRTESAEYVQKLKKAGFTFYPIEGVSFGNSYTDTEKPTCSNPNSLAAIINEMEQEKKMKQLSLFELEGEENGENEIEDTDGDNIFKVLQQALGNKKKSVNYQFVFFALKKKYFECSYFDLIAKNEAMARDFITATLNLVQKEKGLVIPNVFYNMPIHLYPEKGIVLEVPQAINECECNYVALLSGENKKMYTNEYYLGSDAFGLCCITESMRMSLKAETDTFEKFIQATIGV